jgi:DNA-binding HxlR family transcriptional regulator
MTGYGQFCPIAVASEIFAQRWTPLILREMFAGASRFNDLMRGLPRISRTTLTQRLRALERAGVVSCTTPDDGEHARYLLTEAGAELQGVMLGLGAWGQRWIPRFDAQNLDADFLMWNLRRRLATDRLPDSHTVVRVEFVGLPSGYRRGRVFWMLIDQREVDLCLKDPGFEVDLYVEADLAAFAQVWMGDLTMACALRARAIRLAGRRDLVSAFPGWLLLSKFADVPRPPQRRCVAADGRRQ